MAKTPLPDNGTYSISHIGEVHNPVSKPSLKAYFTPDSCTGNRPECIQIVWRQPPDEDNGVWKPAPSDFCYGGGRDVGTLFRHLIRPLGNLAI